MSILADARAVIAEDPVCDACLGRVFAERSFGLTNETRGHALRVAVALEDDEPYDAPGECWVCEGYCDTYDTWAERVVDALDDVEFETYQVGTKTPPLIEENDELLRELAGLPVDAGELFKSAFNREVGKRVGQRTGADVDFERSDVLALLELEYETVDVQMHPAFVYGRYRKRERDIPQTEWPCRECGGSGRQFSPDGDEPCEHCGGDGYLYAMSVEEYTTPAILEVMDGTEAVFHGAGREDVDARMLGTGRPFVVEVKHPRVRRPGLAAVEERINDEADGAVEVEGLRLATHEMTERVKELNASKTYRATVEFGAPVTADALEEALEELTGATIEQYTPQRVDHRRANLTRTRTVHAASGELIDETHAVVEIHGAGGLYIKELISGDDDRTNPSLAGLLGVDAEVTALDVIAVDGDDEPFEDADYFIE